ncbi:ectoine/hydroxyectoine ABC transporter substrate-binding protein EhuB [Cryobacterium sp. Hh38]|uniref:ectoine/hydroxyectoine ABC transporter substrate-binding protein EhuB n=1 Tax=Cryobacterium sp. Hh38 TaxID=1259156 RepID=UPI00106D3902|nr:ectoine/hydroxyectoine ABC transporter substrate-binding protein EhuB [Cryobacterium sp. Hh38]TFD58180.1 ectoine/hydroxyectoine ABC transporter substrate-binding protein EhuB [Cryobacterium sp. Hh38]
MIRHYSRSAAMRGVGVIAAGLLLAGSLSACSATSTGDVAEVSTLQNGKDLGYLRVGIANEPPYTEVNADGSVHGGEPDVLREVLKTMGIGEIQGVITPYDAMIPGLNANRWDVVAAGLFMKQSRCAAVAYSEPVIVSTESYGTPVGNPKNITTIADALDNPDFKIAVLSGGFEEGILKTAELPESQVVLVKDSRSGMEAVTANRADAFLLPTLSLKSLVEQDPSIEVTDPIDDAPRTGSGAAFRKGDTELLAEYNKQLAIFKDTQAYTDIMVKWGFDPEAAKGVTAAELCKNEG